MAKKKILIVDDDNNIASLLSLYLTKEFFECKIAADGETALELNKSFNPDLILLDIMLPGMNLLNGFFSMGSSAMDVIRP